MVVNQRMKNRIQLPGLVVPGHGVASGACNDPRFPEGTIALQKPEFRRRGLDLDRFYSGTINLSIAPLLFRITRASYHFHALRWSDIAAAEDFSFLECSVLRHGEARLEGLVYYPHPETKPEHFQAPDVLEILTLPIPKLAYGDRLMLELNPAQIELIYPGKYTA